jgi:mevalonate kinase
MKHITAQSKGKVIISGEHSVVYGQPALVGGLKLFREVVLREPKKRQIAHSAIIDNIFKIFEDRYGIKVENLEVLDLGKLPVGSGLGSSAAFAHAIFLSLLKHFDLDASKEELFSLVQESEKFCHGNPSGVDATAVVYGGLVEFVRGNEDNLINQIDHQENLLNKNHFFLIDSGRPMETTREMVEMVSEKLKTDQALQKIINKMGQVTQKLIKAVKESSFDGAAIKENQRLLEELGVVGEKAKQIIQQIEQAGAVAKITGAGGILDGSGMILAYSQDHGKISDLIKKNNWKSYQIQIG